MAMTDDLGPGDRGLAEDPEELFRRYYRPLVGFFARRGFSTEDSRDLAQETFFRVYKNWAGFRGESSEVTWLFQIATNLYRNKIRSRSTLKRDMQVVPLDLPDGEPVAADDGQETALDAILLEERTKLLRDALEGLPPQMRQAVLLRVDGDLKYREIAELMSVSIETVKAHLYQARQQLRDKLGDYFRTDIES
jgi:RNA polymerase sigma-70 factor (ECF subfamily)